MVSFCTAKEIHKGPGHKSGGVGNHNRASSTPALHHLLAAMAVEWKVVVTPWSSLCYFCNIGKSCAIAVLMSQS